MHDPHSLMLRKAARAGIVLPISFALALNVFDLGQGALYAAFGVFALLVFADFGGPTRNRALAYLITGGTGLIAIVVGTLAAQYKVSAVVVTFLVGFAVTYAGVLRGYVATAGTAVLLPFVIAATSGPGLPMLGLRLAGWATAVVLATVGALVLWPSHLRSALRSRVAAACSACAATIRAMWPGEVTADSAAVLDVNARMRELVSSMAAVREAYDGRLLRPGNVTTRDRSLLQVIDELNRLALAIKWPVPHRPELAGREAVLASATAKVLDDCGDALGKGGPAPDAAALNPLREAQREDLERWVEQQLATGSGNEVAATLDAGFRLRIIALISQFIGRDTCGAIGAPVRSASIPTLAGFDLSPPTVASTPKAMLASQLTLKSPWFKNSLRAGLAFSIAVGLVYLTGLTHGFWIVLGALVALRFDSLGTRRTALQLVLGTGGGFLIAVAATYLTGNNTTVLWMLLPITVFLAAYTPGVISLAVGQAFFTVFVIVFFAILSDPAIKTGEVRLVDVTLGVAVSLLVSASLWPHGVATAVRKSLQDAVAASTAFMVGSYEMLIGGNALSAATQAQEDAANKAIARAYETFDLSLAQTGPKSMSGATWTLVANGTLQIAAAGRLVVNFTETGRPPVRCGAANDLLLLTAHNIRERIIAASAAMADSAELPTDGGLDVPPVSSTEDPSYPLTRLREAVHSCMQTLADQHKDELGSAVVTLVWAQDWLIHLDWVVRRIEKVIAQQGELVAAASG